MNKSRQVRDFLYLKHLRLRESRIKIGLSTAIKAGYEMKIFRVSGVNKKTGCYEAANVMAGNHEQAIKLMAMSHVRVVCCDKRGVE